MKMWTLGLLLSLALGRSPVLEGQHATVILLHGRGQAGKDLAQLEASWRDALARGLQASGLEPIPTSRVRFVAYKDIFEPGGEKFHCPEGAFVAGGLTEALRRGLRRLADGLATLEGLATAVAMERLADTRAYLTQGSVRCAVNSRLFQALTDSGGVVVVAP